MKAILGYHGGTWSLRKRPLREILRAIDEMSAMPEPSTEGDRTEGDRGFISVIESGFILHAYFGGKNVRFELFGPYEPGTECDPRTMHPGEGLSGIMSVDCLRDVLRLMEEGRPPMAFVRSQALEVDSSTPDD